MRLPSFLRPFVSGALLFHAAVLFAADPQVLTSAAPLAVKLTPDAGKATFTFKNDGSRLVALRVETPDTTCHVRFHARTEASFGGYRTSSDFSMDFRAEREPSQLLDALPQFPAEWTIELALVGKVPAALTIRLEDQGPAPEIVWGEAPGTLLVRNTGQTQITATPERHVRLRHPLFSASTATPDITPGGDALFRLPAGYWDLHAPGGDGVQSIRSALIPVTSGGQTVIDWPQMRSLEGEKLRGLSELMVREASADGDTGTLLVAAPMFPTTPPVEAVRVSEGGQPGQVLSIEAVPASLHVVVLFDSSFSMRKIFGEAQQAALHFVENLPPGCTVDFFDFDTKVRELTAPDRAALLAAIRAIKSDGSTKLYDSVMRGLSKSAAHRRSAVVLFTDGFDARVDDPGYGSRATEEQVFAAVEKARVPFFTIAYGEKPDEQTLQKLAEVSGGAYFRAQADTIASVFDEIRGVVDRDYRITYRRPAKVGPSNTPVLTLVLDVSGSMDMEPTRPEVGRRIEKAKDLLRGFFGRLPAGSVVQLFTFSTGVDLVQVPTSEPARLARALAPIEADGGTETLKATKAALASLERIPSRNRTLLFITDAALKVSDQREHETFANALAQLKEQGIRSLWVGMVGEDQQGPFEEAAALSGGSFVVSPGTESLGRALATLERTLKSDAAGGEVAVEVLINKVDTAGTHHLHGGTGLFPLPVPEFTAEHSVGSLRAVITQGAPQEAATEALASMPPAPGTALPGTGATAAGAGDGARELNRIPIGATGHNEAVEITVHEARIYSRLHGLDLPNTHRFVELVLTLKNVLPEQQVFVPAKGAAHPANWVSGNPAGKTVRMIPPYLIPDIRNHLFLRWNDGAEAPPSILSVLDPEPLFLPDDPSVLVSPDSPREARVVFLVPEPNLRQASLHLYDTSYKHMDLALVGPLVPRDAALVDMPAKASGALSDTFVLHLLGHADSPGPLHGVDPLKENLFRTVQLRFDSKMQALVNLQPAASFDLLIGTDKGPLATPLAPVTDWLPGGLYRDSSVAPGSRNRFQQVYCVPQALASAPSAVFVELRDKDVVFPLGGPLPEFRTSAAVDPASGVAVQVNALGLAPRESGLNARLVIADVTITDVEDTFSTGLGDRFVLAPVAAPGAPFEDPDAPAAAAAQPAATRSGLGGFGGGAQKPRIHRVHATTAELLFGIPRGAVVPDGATRRGILLFDAPAEGEWVLALHGRELARLTAPAAALPADSAALLARRPKYPQLHDNHPQAKAEKLVAELVRKGVIRPRDESRATAAPRVDQSGKVQAIHLPPPRLTVAGEDAWKELLAADEATLWRTLAGLRVNPGLDRPWSHSLSPESVLTQGSGTQNDFAELARAWYEARGIATTTLHAGLSKEGEEQLRAKQPFGELPKRVPLLKTPAGTWGLPFCASDAALTPLLAAEPAKDARPSPSTATITISLIARPIGTTAAAAMGNMAAALGGGDVSTDKRFQLWQGTLPLATLSRDPLDVLYFETGGDSPEIRVHIESLAGSEDGKSGMPTRDWKPVREVIEVRTPGRSPRLYERELDEAPIDATYHAISIAVPDLPTSAAQVLEKRWAEQRTVEPPNHLSLLRWLGRSKIATFVTAQSRWETENATALGVGLARDTAPRVLIFTTFGGEDGSMRQSFDLRQSEPLVHGPDEAVRSFRLMHGFADTAFEGRLLAGQSVSTLWSNPSDYILVPPNQRRVFADSLAEREAPAGMVARVRNGSEYLLFCREPVQFHGKPLWGWYEVDPRTYATVSVLSTGEHGMAERMLVEIIKDFSAMTAGYVAGVDVSVWAVSAFTLEGMPYEQVLTEAEKFASELPDKTWYFGTGVFTSHIALDPTGVNSFSTGYSQGVTFYFIMARRAMNQSNSSGGGGG